MEVTNTELKETARDIFYDYPILEVFGWLFVAYFMVYFITFYVGPTIFGTRPYRPFYGRRRRSVPASGNPNADDAGLIAAVFDSIDKTFY